MASENHITAAFVRQALDYDPATGEFRWRVRPNMRPQCNALFAGKIAGGFDKKGYRRIGIDGRLYRAHRLAWLWMTGAWPPNEIDHIDLDKANNRWGNLRLATGSQNQHNRGAYSTNTTGAKGIGWHKHTRKWRARTRLHGMQIHIGLFDTIAEAAAAYAAAAAKYHGEFSRVS